MSEKEHKPADNIGPCTALGRPLTDAERETLRAGVPPLTVSAGEEEVQTMSEKPLMSLAAFQTLKRRDFENGAVLDDIYLTLKFYKQHTTELKARVAELERENQQRRDECARVWSLEKADNVEQLLVDLEAEKQRAAELEARNEGNLEGWRQNVAGLQRRVAELERERDEARLLVEALRAGLKLEAGEWVPLPWEKGGAADD